MISRNKREGYYCGTWGTAHARSKEPPARVSSSAAKLCIAVQMLGPGARFLEDLDKERNASCSLGRKNNPYPATFYR